MREKEQEISLYDLNKFYIKNWIWIVALTLLGLAIGLVYTFYVQTPLYKSQATLLIVQPGLSTNSNDTTISNYVELFKSRRVLEPVMNELQVSDSYETFVSRVEANNNKNTAIIRVAVTDKSADFSKAATDKAIASFQNEVKDIYEISNVRIVDGASLPANPYNVNILIQTAIATIAGFMMSAIGLFFAYDYKQSNKKAKSKLSNVENNKIKNAEAIEKNIQNEERKKLALEIKAKRIEAKNAKREAKRQKIEAAKKAIARRKAIAKKAYENKIKAKKAANEIKRQENSKAKKLANETKKLAKFELAKKRMAIREARMTNLKQVVKNTFSPLITRLQEAGDANKLNREARQAERLARHEERMAEIEAKRVKSIEKRANIASQSKKIESRIAKDSAIVSNKKSTNKIDKSKDKTDTVSDSANKSIKESKTVAKSGTAFYASVQNVRLNRRGFPLELATADNKSKRGVLGRIKRSISKQINLIKNK